MKTLLILFIFSSFASEAEAKCNTKAIGYYNQSGFGISFGGGGSSAGYYDKNTINVPNGCSNDFATSMKNYQLENYEANDSLKDYKVKKKWFSDDLVFEW